MLTLNPAVWLKDSALGMLKPRSASLKGLDAAILANHPVSNWAKSAAIAKAYLDWTSPKANTTSERMGKPAVQTLERNLGLQLAVLRVKPDFNWSNTTLLPYFNATLISGTAGAAARQAALDNIPRLVAMNEKVVLQAAINLFPDAFYLDVESYTGHITASPRTTRVERTTSSVKVRYDSAGYTLRGKVTNIVPASQDVNVGIIQQCSFKEDIATYADGVQVEDFTTLTFPVGDSASDIEEPWYLKRPTPGTNCTHPCFVSLRGKPAGTVTVEMNDCFVNNFHFGKVYEPGTVLPPPGGSRGRNINQLLRRQTF